MEIEELCRALRRMKVETGSLLCLDCGYEHGCTVHGCALIREAADNLEQLNDFERSQCAKLLARIGELEEKPRWRRPGEEMPTEHEIVLVIANGRIEEKITFIDLIDAMMMASWSKTEGWILEMFPETETGFEIRYWMPLPEPPARR